MQSAGSGVPKPHIVPIPEGSIAGRVHAPASRGGGPASRGGGPASRAGGPASRGGGPASRGGGPAARGGGPASLGMLASPPPSVVVPLSVLLPPSPAPLSIGATAASRPASPGPPVPPSPPQPTSAIATTRLHRAYVMISSKRGSA